MSRVDTQRCNRVIYRATCTHCGRDTMDSPTLPSLSSTWKILISPEGGYERQRETERGWANNDDCWLRFQPGIRETCRFFPLSRYLQRLPSLSDTCFPAIDGRNRGKDKGYIRLVHRDVETLLIPLLISIIFSCSRSISMRTRQRAFPSGRISMIACNRWIGTNFTVGISEFQQQHGLLNAIFVCRLSLKLES